MVPPASDDAPLTEITNPRKRRLFDRLVARDGALCQHCGATTWLTIDHVDPAGPDILENLQILCRSCNSSKGDRVEERTVRWANGMWQRGFTMIPNAVLLDIALSPAAFRVFAVLVYLSWRPDDEWPGQAGLAGIAQCSERTLRTAISDLCEAKLLKTQRRGQGLTNVYILTVPPRSATSAGQESRAEKPAGQERKKPPISPLLQDLELDLGQVSPPETKESLVCAAWTRLAPPLIPHRETFLRAKATQTKIRSALKIHPVEDVVAAIENYAKILASDEYVWSYRWTLTDFLTRGLDKFVPDADPLGNMPRKRPGAKAADFSEFGDGGY